MYQLIYTDRALEDLERGKKWYNTKQPGLGKKFVDYVFDYADDLKKYPHTFSSKYKNTREIYIKKYPYILIYSVEEQIIFILRVFPCKTEPGKKYKSIHK